MPLYHTQIPEDAGLVLKNTIDILGAEVGETYRWAELEDNAAMEDLTLPQSHAFEEDSETHFFVTAVPLGRTRNKATGQA